MISRFFTLMAVCFSSCAFANTWTLTGTADVGADGLPQLNLALRYSGKAKHSFYAADLPWGIKSSITLVVFTIEESPKLLEPVPLIDDPSPNRVQVRPGQKLDGQIALRQRYKSADLKVDRYPLAICWTYEMRKISAGSKDVASDCSVLKR
jgi:hypothetical protein